MGGRSLGGSSESGSSYLSGDSWTKESDHGFSFAKQKEKFEQAFFGALYCVVENTDSSIVVPLLAFFFDFLMILAFNLRPSFPWGQKTRETAAMFVSFLQLEVSSVFKDYTQWVIAFYIIVFTVFLGFGLLAYVGWKFASSKFDNLWVVRLLKTYLSTLATVLFLPFTNVLLGPLQCTYIGVPTPVMDKFSGLHCWDWSQNGPHALVAAFTLPIFFAFSFLVCAVFFDSNPTSADPTRCPHAYFDLVLLSCRTILALCSAFIKSRTFILALVNLTLNVICFSVSLFYLPYFWEVVTKVRTGFFAAILYSSMCLMATVVGNDPSSESTSIALFVGLVPAFCLGFFASHMRYKSVLFPQIAEHVARLTANATQGAEEGTGDHSRTDSQHETGDSSVIATQSPQAQAMDGGGVFGDGFVIRNVMSAESSVRFRKSASREDHSLQSVTTAGGSGGGLAQDRALVKKKRFYFDVEVEMYARFVWKDSKDKDMVDLAECIYEEGLKQHPASMFLQLSFSTFLSHVGKQAKADAIFEKVCTGRRPNILYRFVVYAAKKDHEKKRKSAFTGEQQQLDLLAVVEFNENYKKARDYHMDSVFAMKELWRTLLPPDACITSLPAIMESIYNSEKRADQRFHFLLTKFGNSPRVLRSYASFLEDVKNDVQGAQKYYAKAEAVEEDIAQSLSRRLSHPALTNPSGGEVHKSTDEEGDMAEQSGGHEEVAVRADKKLKPRKPTASVGGGVSSAGSRRRGASARFRRAMRGQRSRRSSSLRDLHKKIGVALVFLSVLTIASYVINRELLNDVLSYLHEVRISGDLTGHFLSQMYNVRSLVLATAANDHATVASIQASLAETSSSWQDTAYSLYYSNSQKGSSELKEFYEVPSMFVCTKRPANPADCKDTVNMWPLMRKIIVTFKMIAKLEWRDLTTLSTTNMYTYVMDNGLFTIMDGFEKLQTFYRLIAAANLVTVRQAVFGVGISALGTIILLVVLLVQPSFRKVHRERVKVLTIFIKVPKPSIQSLLLRRYNILDEKTDDEEEEEESEEDMSEKETSQQQQPAPLPATPQPQPGGILHRAASLLTKKALFATTSGGGGGEELPPLPPVPPHPTMLGEEEGVGGSVGNGMQEDPEMCDASESPSEIGIQVNAQAQPPFFIPTVQSTEVLAEQAAAWDSQMYPPWAMGDPNAPQMWGYTPGQHERMMQEYAAAYYAQFQMADGGGGGGGGGSGSQIDYEHPNLATDATAVQQRPQKHFHIQSSKSSDTASMRTGSVGSISSTHSLQSYLDKRMKKTKKRQNMNQKAAAAAAATPTAPTERTLKERLLHFMKSGSEIAVSPMIKKMTRRYLLVVLCLCMLFAILTWYSSSTVDTIVGSGSEIQFSAARLNWTIRTRYLLRELMLLKTQALRTETSSSLAKMRTLHNALLFGRNPDYPDLKGSAQRYGPQEEIYYSTNCLLYDKSQCPDPSSPISVPLLLGASSLFRFYTDYSKEWVATTNLTSTDDRYQFITGVGFNNLHDGFDRAVEVYVTETTGIIDHSLSIQGGVMGINLVLIMVLYFGLLQPMVRYLREETRRTTGMLHMLPQKVMQDVPELQQLLEDEAEGANAAAQQTASAATALPYDPSNASSL